MPKKKTKPATKKFVLKISRVDAYVRRVNEALSSADNMTSHEYLAALEEIQGDVEALVDAARETL